MLYNGIFRYCCHDDMGKVVKMLELGQFLETKSGFDVLNATLVAGHNAYNSDDAYSYYDEYYSGNENRFYYDGDISRLREPWLTEPSFIPTAIVYGLAFLIGVGGNGLVIFAVTGDYKQRTNTTMFLVSLATSDILFLLVCVSYEISSYFIDHWQLGTVLCKFSGFVEMVTATLTVLNLTIVSVERGERAYIINSKSSRYMAIVHPMRMRYLCTLGNMKKLIPMVWVIAAFLSSPAFFIMSTEMSVFYNNQSSVTMVFCSDHGVHGTFRISLAVYQLLIMFIIPTVIMVICYVRIVHVLWASTKQLSKLAPSESVCDATFLSRVETCSLGGHSHSPAMPRLLKRAITNHKSKVLASRKQIIKLLLMIIVAFLLCWGPKLTLRIFKKLQLPFLFSEEAYIVKIIVDCLPFIQSCINPIIYCFMSRNFRRSIRVLFTRKSRDTGSRPDTGDVAEFQTCTSSSDARRNRTRAQYFQLVYRASADPEFQS